MNFPSSRKEAKNKGYKHYYTGERCKKGHLSIRLASTHKCVECNKEWAREKRKTDPEYLQKQREISRINNGQKYHNDSKYRAKLLEQCAIRERKKYAEDPLFRERRKQYRRDRLKRSKSAREKYNASQRRRRQERMETDDHFIASQAWRSLIKRMVRMGHNKTNKTIDELGYSVDEFMDHIESQFQEGMNWRNHGEWHIDHIKPVTSFPKDSNPSEVNALENLQPLWAFDNLSKGNRE